MAPLLRLAVPGALLIAAVFAAHPPHGESVAWIIKRKDLLSALFYRGAVLAWLRFAEGERVGHYLLLALLFAAGLPSKSVVVSRSLAGGLRGGGGAGAVAVAVAGTDRARAAGGGAVLRADAGPVPGFVDYGSVRFSFVADRFQYLAGIGVLAVPIGTAAHAVGRLTAGERSAVALRYGTWGLAVLPVGGAATDSLTHGPVPPARRVRIRLPRSYYDDRAYPRRCR